MSIRIYRTGIGVVIERNGLFWTPDLNWDALLNSSRLFQECLDLTSDANRASAVFPDTLMLPPLEGQEIWASGVTYLKSKEGRQEESKDAGGGIFYQMVYEAPRPELFYKGSAARTAGPGGIVRIRKDSTWNVPEPELTLLINSAGEIAGYTIGNDMSSRSIEGENPLYLPQAKVYDGSAALGPCIYVSDEPLPGSTLIELRINRKGEEVFKGSVAIDRIKREFGELAEYLYRECSFPQGCFLMTGTGIVPPPEFTLQHGDEIRITVDPIGVLINYVE